MFSDKMNEDNRMIYIESEKVLKQSFVTQDRLFTRNRQEDDVRK